MYVRIRGKPWKIKFANIRPDDGRATRPRTVITICKGMHIKDEVETVVHELIHSCYWDMGEEAVYEAARDITKILWKLYKIERKDS